MTWLSRRDRDCDHIRMPVLDLSRVAGRAVVARPEGGHKMKQNYSNHFAVARPVSWSRRD